MRNPTQAVPVAWSTAGAGGAPEAFRSALAVMLRPAMAAAVVLAGLVVAVAAVRRALVRRALADRVVYHLVPGELLRSVA